MNFKLFILLVVFLALAMSSTLNQGDSNTNARNGVNVIEKTQVNDNRDDDNVVVHNGLESLDNVPKIYGKIKINLNCSCYDPSQLYMFVLKNKPAQLCCTRCLSDLLMNELVEKSHPLSNEDVKSALNEEHTEEKTEETIKPDKSNIPTVVVPDARVNKKGSENLKPTDNPNDNVEAPDVIDDIPERKKEENDMVIPEKVPKPGPKVDEDNKGDDITLEHSDDIPSFDEWKTKMLNEQAQQGLVKSNEGQVIRPNNGESKKTNQHKVNYASATCGAKLHSSNTEASNAASILSENKDQYMNQPCNAKKWFIVELCEPVKIQYLEFGNQELFSSLPKNFNVSISDRPTSHWKILGTFHAQDKRKIQRFIINDDMYAKYIKVDLLTHFGKEHFCPLSVIRVFGQDLHEDEGDEVHDVQEEPDIHDVPTAEDGESKNLFNSAKDTVISLVKTVLNGNNKEDNTESNKVVNMSEKNVNKTEDTKDEEKPCMPENIHEGPIQPKTPDVKTAPDSMDQMPLVRIMEMPLNTFSSNYCLVCRNETMSNECKKESFCDYYQIFQPKTVKEQLFPSTDVLEQSKLSESRLKDKDDGYTSNKKIDTSDTDEMVAYNRDGVKNTVLPEDLKVAPENEEIENVNNPSQQGESEENEASLANGTEQSLNKEIVKTDKQYRNPQLHGPETIQIRPLEMKESKESDKELDIGRSEDATLPDTATNILPKEEIHQLDSSRIEDNKAQEPFENRDTTPEKLMESSVNGHKIVYADEVTSDDENEQRVSDPGVEGDIQIQKYRSAQKETTYMKLKNKIRELEINLTLSSRYLEELSVKYKQRMEDMYRSLNKTIQKLTNTSKTAEKRDSHQQERIAVLEKKVQNLTDITIRLMQNFSNIYPDVIMQHVCFFVLEVIVLFLFTQRCIYNLRNNMNEKIQTISNSYFNMAVKDLKYSTPVKSPGHRRGQSHDFQKTPFKSDSSVSVPCESHAVEDIIGRKKSGSASDITILKPNFSMFVCKNNEANKKKRKKKLFNGVVQSKTYDNLQHYTGSNKAKNGHINGKNLFSNHYKSADIIYDNHI